MTLKIMGTRGHFSRMQTARFSSFIINKFDMAGGKRNGRSEPCTVMSKLNKFEHDRRLLTEKERQELRPRMDKNDCIER